MKKLRKWLLNSKNLLFLILSFAIAILLWSLISSIPSIGSIIVSPNKVFNAFMSSISDGSLLTNTKDSLIRVLGGFFLGILVSIPIAFLLGWYKPFRILVEPWIQFLRTIPPIALIPLIIAAFGIGDQAKIVLIFFAVFLTMVISIYQGVTNVDQTLIKAARVFEANDLQIFLQVVVPASFPYILVGIRLGLSVSLTTLVAAELIGASSGLGHMIQQASMYFNMDTVLLGIITIGIIGFVFDKIILFMEKKLTSWQEGE